MELCEICNMANRNRFPPSNYPDGHDCYICEGRATATPSMVTEAAKMLETETRNDRLASFSISTIMPKDWLAREEKAWDIHIEGCESIKNYLNRTISSALRKVSKAAHQADGEIKIIFDYSSSPGTSAGSVSLERNELFVFGRYKKHLTGLSQSRWTCLDCEGKGCNRCDGRGKHYESVEECIGEPIKKATQAANYIMHASGREDVDATNTAGRAFVMEIKDPKQRRPDLDKIKAEIAGSNKVSVSDLTEVHRSFLELVTESHFDKKYEADIEFGREVGADEVQKICTLAGRTILQQTPKRVAHRRANLVRHRKIKTIDVVGSSGKNATLRIMAEAGTYIKELISGDTGRTNPSIAGELGTKAECKRLEVVAIDDGYIDMVLGLIKAT